MEVKEKTYEVVEAPASGTDGSGVAAVVAQANAPTETRSDVVKKGWSETEIKAAEERGMLKKEETPEEKKTREATEAAEKAKANSAANGKPPAKKGTLPEFNMTPEQEKVFLETFGAGTDVRAMYFRMKNERESRQKYQTDYKNTAEENVRLKAEIEAIKKGAIKPPEPELDENGNPIDPKDKPLTAAQLEQIEKEKEQKKKDEDARILDLAKKANEAMKGHEAVAIESYPDYEPTVKLAQDLLKNFDTLLPNPKDQARLAKLVRDLQVAAATAQDLGPDDLTAPDLSYEIGKMHPDYGQEPDEPADKGGTGKEDDDPSGDGGQTNPSDKMKRIDKSTQRRSSSAAIAGGGKRTVVASQVTLAQLNSMTKEQRGSFRKDHPNLYDKLMRG